jgi:hypothetical protein
MPRTAKPTAAPQPSQVQELTLADSCFVCSGPGSMQSMLAFDARVNDKMGKIRAKGFEASSRRFFLLRILQCGRALRSETPAYSRRSPSQEDWGCGEAAKSIPGPVCLAPVHALRDDGRDSANPNLCTRQEQAADDQESAVKSNRMVWNHVVRAWLRLWAGTVVLVFVR